MRQQLIIESETKNISLGVFINDELSYLDILFIKTFHKHWGIVVVDPDGNSYHEIRQNNQFIEMIFDVDDKSYRLIVFNNDSELYTIRFEEIQ